MDDRSNEDECPSCAESTSYNISFSEGERITTCSSCGKVIKYEKE